MIHLHRLKKRLAGELSKFEQEIRNPGKALREAILKMRKENINHKDIKPIIDKAIEEDIGWSREDILNYFELYSDCHKDCYGVRPHYDYTSTYYETIYDFMVLLEEDSCNYTDYSSLKYEDYEISEDENEVWNKEDDMDIDDDIYIEENDKAEPTDEYDKLPFQQSHHKNNYKTKK